MKTQTIEEFLAKGGVIKKLTPSEVPVKSELVKSTVSGGTPVTILTLGEADLYYGEIKPRKVKKKTASTLDLSALPPELRKKYVDDVINGNDKEKEEDDEEEGCEDCTCEPNEAAD